MSEFRLASPWGWLMLLAILDTFYLNVPALAQTTWTWIQPTPQGNTLISSSACRDKAYFLGDAGTLLVTSDGGITWTDLSPYHSPIEKWYHTNIKNQLIAFATEDRGFITASFPTYNTTNGGLTWEPVVPFITSNQIYFSSEKLGWAGGASCYRTTDAGTSWMPMSALANGDGYVTGFSSFDSVHGFLFTGQSGASGRAGVIKYTTDGGGSWSYRPTGLRSGGDTSFSFLDVKVNSSGLGVAAGFAQKTNTYRPLGFILRTSDFGLSWQRTSVLPQFNTIISMSDSLWVLLGNDLWGVDGVAYQSYIARSTDSAKSWSYVANDPHMLAPKTGVWLPTVKVILAGGYYGAMYRSSDLGLTWQTAGVHPPNLRDVGFAPYFLSDSKFGIAVGDSGHVLRSSDQGDHWSKTTANVDKQIDLLCFSGTIGMQWIGGTRHALLRSVNDGIDWTNVQLPFDPGAFSDFLIKDIYAQDILHASMVFGRYSYYSDPSYVLYTENGGNTFVKITLPPRLQAHTIAMNSPNHIFAGGIYWPENSSSAEGFIWRTTDAGASYDTLHLPNTIEKIVMLNDRVGIAGANGAIYRTSDAGDSWTLTFSTQLYVSDLSFENEKSGWAIVSNDLMFTDDSGKNWSMASTRTPNLESGSGLAVESSGRIFLITQQGGFLSTASSVLTSLDETGYSRPNVFGLMQNYPNPFNPFTVIRYSLPLKIHVTLRIYNVIGQEVATLVDEIQDAGFKQVEWNASQLPSGLYVYRLTAGDFTDAKKLLLVK